MADYTEVVMASAVTGAVIGNLVFGGVPPAAIGALVGGSLASLWFMHEVSANYQNRHHGDSRPSPNR